MHGFIGDDRAENENGKPIALKLQRMLLIPRSRSQPIISALILAQSLHSRRMRARSRINSFPGSCIVTLLLYMASG